MVSLTGVFALVLVVMNVMVHMLVTRRIQSLSRIADEMSLGKLDGFLARQVPRWRAQLESYHEHAGWPGLAFRHGTFRLPH